MNTEERERKQEQERERNRHQDREIENGKRYEEDRKKEARIVISSDADTAVLEMTEAVNDGFEAGRATRFDVASFMILWCKTHSNDDVIHEMRRQLADSFSMLDAIHKKAKSSGDLPQELKQALEQYFFGSGTQSQKKNKKSLKQESINERPIEGEAA
jgi:hypothetical protein